MSFKVLVRRAFEFKRGEVRGLTVLLILSLVIRYSVVGYLDWRQRALDSQLDQYLSASALLLEAMSQRPMGHARDSLPDTATQEPTSNARVFQPYTKRENPALPPKQPLVVDINKAGQEALEQLPGIGPVLAKRAVRFREGLGGFHSIDQFADLYGLTDSVFIQLRPLLSISSVELRQLSVNEASYEELKHHPYVAPWVAESIVEYREQTGSFLDLSELKRLGTINDSLYLKLQPYLVVK